MYNKIFLDNRHLEKSRRFLYCLGEEDVNKEQRHQWGENLLAQEKCEKEQTTEKSKKRKGKNDMYKRMNNHFGVSRIFSKARFKIEGDIDNQGTDVNEVGTGGGGGSSSSESDKGNPMTNDGPTVESLMAELAAEKAKSLKLQNEKDTASSEAANYKKKLREKMTAEEQLDAAKKEQEAAKDALIAEYQTKEKIRDCTEFLMDSSVGMDKKTAKEFAQKFIESDFENAMPILEKHIKAIKDTAYQQALSDRPDPKAGNGDANKNDSAIAIAAAYASRNNGVNMDILNKY